MLSVLSRNNFGNNSHTKLLVQSFNKTNGSTTFTDTSRGGSTHTITAEGGASHTTTLSKFGTSSIDLSALVDYLSTPYSNDFNISGQISFDLWIYIDTITTFPPFFGTSDNAYSNRYAGVFDTSSDTLRFFTEVDDTLNFYEKSAVVSSDTWYHIAISIDVDAQKVFYHLNGNYLGELSYTDGELSSYTRPLLLGANYVNSSNTNRGNTYNESFRIRQGEVYPKRNFTPPNRPY